GERGRLRRDGPPPDAGADQTRHPRGRLRPAAAQRVLRVHRPRACRAAAPAPRRAAAALPAADGRRPARGPAPMLAMIHVENLTKSFRDMRRGQVLAVDHLSFDAHPGEVFGLLGPNGAGKTTAMRILCTVLRPSGGVARVAGYDVVTQAGQVRQNI